jgi:hypothetical protein
MTIKDEDIVQSRSTIVISGAKQAYDLAFNTTKFHGRVIAVGVPHGPVPIDSKPWPEHEVGNLADSKTVLGMILQDKSLIGEFPLRTWAYKMLTIRSY